MNERALDLAGEFALRLWSEGVVVVRDLPVVLKSGRTTHIYVNFRDFALAPDNLALMCGLFRAWLDQARMASAGGGRAGGEEKGGQIMIGAAASLLSPFLAGALARDCGLPVALHRPGREEKGLSDTVFFAGRNPSMQGQPALPVILVDDVASTGGTLVAAAQAFAQAGLGQAQAFVFVDKRRASETDQAGLEIHAPLTLAQILEQGLEQSRVTTAMKGKVRAEMAYLGS